MTQQPNKCITEWSNNYLEMLKISWCPFPFISRVDWADCNTGRVKMIPSLDKHKYWVDIPRPSPSQMPESSDECDCFDLTPVNWSLWASWGLGVELSLGIQTSSFQWFMQFYQLKVLNWWTITTRTQLLFFLFCRFGKLFVVLGCETFEFLMTLEALNFVLVLLTCTKLEFAEAQCKI